MKSELIEPKTSEVAYPCLMLGDGHSVVLFFEPGCGICVFGGRANYLGEYSDGWEMSCFRHLPPGSKVVLEA